MCLCVSTSGSACVTILFTISSSTSVHLNLATEWDVCEQPVIRNWFQRRPWRPDSEWVTLGESPVAGWKAARCIRWLHQSRPPADNGRDNTKMLFRVWVEVATRLCQAVGCGGWRRAITWQPHLLIQPIQFHELDCSKHRCSYCIPKAADRKKSFFRFTRMWLLGLQIVL